MEREGGVTLIEAACALAIVALLTTIVLPAIPRATSQNRLAGYAADIAALLKRDRDAAMRNHVTIATALDPEQRTIRSGDGAKVVEIPSDVTFSALLAQRCADRLVGTTIDFFPSGASCGGTVAISRQGFGYQIRVNWLTGGIEIVAIGSS